MKRILCSVAAMAGVLYVGAAQAAGSCEKNLTEVNAAWQKHLEMAEHGNQNQSPTKATIESVIKHGEADCLAGKNDEANENLALARRHMRIKEFKSGHDAGQSGGMMGEQSNGKGH